LKIRENRGATGVGVLATYTYYNLGNRTSLTFGNGASETYAYDPVSRLKTHQQPCRHCRRFDDWRLDHADQLQCGI
jgi:uncharacterized protein RhaS with RHS repeats